MIPPCLSCRLLPPPQAAAGGESSSAATAAAAATSPAGFRYLLSLHAFAVTDVELITPPRDPAKFVRSLAPYLKLTAAGGVGAGWLGARLVGIWVGHWREARGRAVRACFVPTLTGPPHLPLCQHLQT